MIQLDKKSLINDYRTNRTPTSAGSRTTGVPILAARSENEYSNDRHLRPNPDTVNDDDADYCGIDSNHRVSYDTAIQERRTSPSHGNFNPYNCVTNDPEGTEYDLSTRTPQRFDHVDPTYNHMTEDLIRQSHLTERGANLPKEPVYSQVIKRPLRNNFIAENYDTTTPTGKSSITNRCIENGKLIEMSTGIGTSGRWAAPCSQNSVKHSNAMATPDNQNDQDNYSLSATSSSEYSSQMERSGYSSPDETSGVTDSSYSTSPNEEVSVGSGSETDTSDNVAPTPIAVNKLYQDVVIKAGLPVLEEGSE